MPGGKAEALEVHACVGAGILGRWPQITPGPGTTCSKSQVPLTHVCVHACACRWTHRTDILLSPQDPSWKTMRGPESMGPPGEEQQDTSCLPETR